jgi:hypothetical protein
MWIIWDTTTTVLNQKTGKDGDATRRYAVDIAAFTSPARMRLLPSEMGDIVYRRNRSTVASGYRNWNVCVCVLQ